MGLDYHGIRTIAYAKSLYPNLNTVAMIGRQNLHASRESIEKIFNEFGITYGGAELIDLIKRGDGYCDPLLEKIGFKVVASYDYSDYEKPTHTHDFNLPISSEHHQKYDFIVDGGSLEHIFNFPVALRNAMEMVKTGGLFISLTPCNNECGHGFYQFSPELYYSLMKEENGYQLIDLFCHEIPINSAWYRPINPKKLRNRISIITSKPIMMVVLAKRTLIGELPQFSVQQSDYEIRWAGETLDNPIESAVKSSFKSRSTQMIKLFIPLKIIQLIRKIIERENFPSKIFDRVSCLKIDNHR